MFSSSGGHDRNSSTESRHSGAVETAFLRPRRNAGAERPRRPSARGAILSLSGGAGVPKTATSDVPRAFEARKTPAHARTEGGVFIA